MPENSTIRLVTMLKRKPGTTHDEFLAHWFNVHGPLIANSAIAPLVQRYEQHPAVWPEDDDAHEPDWDGVTIQEYASVADFWAQVQLPDFVAMQADIDRFLDTDNMPWILLDEANVVIDSGSSPTTAPR